MQEKTRKLITWICMGIAVVASVFAVLFAMDQEKFAGMYNMAYGILLFFVALAIVAIVLFLLLNIRTSKGLFIGLGALVVVGLVAFLLSSGTDVNPALLAKNGLTEGASKIIGAGCFTVYILCALAAIAILYVEVARFFKK